MFIGLPVTPLTHFIPQATGSTYTAARFSLYFCLKNARQRSSLPASNSSVLQFIADKMSPYTYFKVTTSRGLTYNYIRIPPSQENKSYILFLHGFPSSSRDWRLQISHFSNKGYGIIVPDCLGYGGTSKPLETSFYNLKAMATDIHDILVHEKIEKVIGVAHDWYVFL